jgi:hypothetical protein
LALKHCSKLNNYEQQNKGQILRDIEEREKEKI